MGQEQDWRYENAKKYDGAELFWYRYEAPTLKWDHDYCAASWLKFSEVNDPADVLDA